MRSRLRRLLGGPRPHLPPLVEPTPFSGDEKARNARNRAAVELVDDDTFGYIVIRLKKPLGSSQSRIEVSGHVLPTFWPAFHEVLGRVIHSGSEFYPTD